MELSKLWTICSSNGIVLSLEQLKSLERYHNELKYWNTKINLISRKDEENILERHILHSLTLVKYIDFKPKSKIIDVGSGGGLPGIPVKIACPEVDMLMVDSIRKKIKTTEMFAKHTGLRKVSCLCSRVEDLASDISYKNKFDFVISRAVAKTMQIVDWTLPLIKKNASILLLKGGNLDDEIYETKKMFPFLDISVIDIDIFSCPYFKNEEKKIVVCRYK